MDDLISRDALLAAYDAAHKGPPGGARKLIEEAPAVDAEPVKRGRWTEDDCCSECGQYVYHGDMRNFCPHCGAKNVEEKL